MSISPFSARPASPDGESRRTRLALAIAVLGIAATLLAYGLSPGVRHAVNHAAHSVNHAVSHVLDRDRTKPASKRPAHAVTPAHSAQPGHLKPPGGARPIPTGAGGTPAGG